MLRSKGKAAISVGIGIPALIAAFLLPGGYSRTVFSSFKIAAYKPSILLKYYALNCCGLIAIIDDSPVLLLVLHVKLITNTFNEIPSVEAGSC